MPIVPSRTVRSRLNGRADNKWEFQFSSLLRLLHDARTLLSDREWLDDSATVAPPNNSPVAAVLERELVSIMWTLAAGETSQIRRKLLIYCASLL
jgi:hypothetical protein